jgi:hypothetical protein
VACSAPDAVRHVHAGFILFHADGPGRTFIDANTAARALFLFDPGHDMSLLVEGVWKADIV